MGDKNLIVVPESLYERVIKMYHNSVSNCHSGIENSVDSCRQKYWFHRMSDEFKLYVSACPICNKIKQNRKNLRAPLQPIIARSFNEIISIVHVVVSKNCITPRRNRYVLTIACLFTGYLVAVPCKSQGGDETIKHVIREWFLKFGFPLQIIHDCHKNFLSE